MKRLKIFILALTLIGTITDATRADTKNIWTKLFSDTLEKYAGNENFSRLCPSIEACLNEVESIEDRSDLKLSEIFDRLLIKFHSEYSPYERLKEIENILSWLRAKYGIIDDLILKPLEIETAGTYRTPGTVEFTLKRPSLPRSFNPNLESSIQELDAYISRKWGGLKDLAEPQNILFSELGTHDTLSGLKVRGFTEFYSVNAPYALRGSRSLLAFKEGETKPTLVFHSFVSRDLFDHKLMQLRLFFGSRFKDIQMLSSNNLKSWEVAALIVTRGFKTLPDIRIDDLVVGYTDIVQKNLESKNAEFLGETRIGDFATIKYFRFKGKNFERTVALLTDADWRYFGKSVTLLIKPFLERGIDRVIFAGSAGSFDPKIPIHSLVVPKNFHLLNDTGDKTTRVDLDNDLFNLLPIGTAFSGPHISVSSPLVESRKMVRWLREDQHMLTVDVEGSRIAEVISDFNSKKGARVRLAAAFIVSDTPVARGDPIKSGKVGLHNPQFGEKKKTKYLYASALDLLWEIPDRFRPSNHTRLVIKYFSDLIAAYQQRGNAVALAVLYSEIENRLKRALEFLKEDLRVSNGIIKGYRDLLRILDTAGISPLSPEYKNEIRLKSNLKRLSKAHQKIILLQSLSRSSTLSSGKDREAAMTAIENAADFIIKRANRSLTDEEFSELHAIANQGILPAADLGLMQDFDYRPWDAPAKSSLIYRDEFLKWMSSVNPSAESAYETYLRAEHLHLAKDGNGRHAELLAQHFMLRAYGHPLVFPHRFDIDYILSLRRNGSTDAEVKEYLNGLLADSKRFSDFIRTNIASENIEDISFDRKSGFVQAKLKDRSRILIMPIFFTRQKIRLEKEERILLNAEISKVEAFREYLEQLPSEEIADLSTPLFIAQSRLNRKQYALDLNLFHIADESQYFSCRAAIQALL